MDRKNIPLLLMLTAGAITCIITYVMNFSILEKLVSLFLVLLIFFVLGSTLKWALDSFERQNEALKAAAEEEARAQAEAQSGENAEPENIEA